MDDWQERWMGSCVQAEVGQSRKSKEDVVFMLHLCDHPWGPECLSLCLVCWWSGPCDESQYSAIAQLSELPRTHTKRYDVSGHNFLTFSSHRRTTVSSSAPPLATPFPKCKSLNPKVIYPMHVSNLWATCVCFKVCRMYFCNIISYLCN